MIRFKSRFVPFCSEHEIDKHFIGSNLLHIYIEQIRKSRKPSDDAVIETVASLWETRKRKRE